MYPHNGCFFDHFVVRSLSEYASVPARYPTASLPDLFTIRLYISLTANVVSGLSAIAFRQS
ncbi:MAG: hypothetical protein MR787_01470 [Bacteroidales bacterium]|nr:hypothetical protein [Bacteroidales bacterium]